MIDADGLGFVPFAGTGSFAGRLLSLLILGFKQHAGLDGRAAGGSFKPLNFVSQFIDFGGLFLNQAHQQQDQR